MENKYYKKIDYELLDEKVAYKGKRIVVEELHYKNPRTNQILYREHVLAGHAAVILPETDNGEFIMIKEPRTPIGKTVIAFPAGMIEDGESEEEGAIRELEEETGYRAGSIKKLREVYPAIGYSNERVNIFLAKDLVKTQRHLDETEDIEVIKIPIKEIKEMLDRQEILTSSEQIGLLHYFLYENK
jgi:ADP-ribose pyrophosphatase